MRKKRTRSGQKADIGLAGVATAGGEQEDKKRTRGEEEEKSNRRTRSGDRLAAVAKLHTRRRTRGQKAFKRGQQEDNIRTQRSPARPDCGQAFS